MTSAIGFEIERYHIDEISKADGGYCGQLRIEGRPEDCHVAL